MHVANHSFVFSSTWNSFHFVTFFQFNTFSVCVFKINFHVPKEIEGSVIIEFDQVITIFIDIVTFLVVGQVTIACIKVGINIQVFIRRTNG